MATVALEARFEHMSMHDEINEHNRTKLCQKAKVGPLREVLVTSVESTK